MDCLCLTKFSFLRPRDEESRRNKNVHKSINFMKAEKKYILRETEQRNLRVIVERFVKVCKRTGLKVRTLEVTP